MGQLLSNSINKLIGIPFESGGRSYNGADCFGIVYLFYKDYLGVTLDFKIDFSNNPFDEHLIPVNKFKEVGHAKEFDIISYIIPRPENPKSKLYHCNLYLGNDRIVEISKLADSHIKMFSSFQHKRNIYKIHRLVK